VLTNPNARQEYDARLAGPSVPAPPEAIRPSSPAAPSSRAAMPWPNSERLLAALGYGMLLLIGFAISFCLTFQSVRPGRPAAADKSQSPAPPPSGEQEP
jgi:hypothetical protein